MSGVKAKGKKGWGGVGKETVVGRGWKPCGCDGGGKVSVDGEEDVGRESLISYMKKCYQTQTIKSRNFDFEHLMSLQNTHHIKLLRVWLNLDDPMEAELYI